VRENFLNSADDAKAANSLFHNILRASHSGSRFCRECRRSGRHKSNQTRILQSREEKNVEGRLGGAEQQVPPLRFSFLLGMRSSGRDDNPLTRDAALKRRSSTDGLTRSAKKAAFAGRPLQTRIHRTPDGSTPAAAVRAGSGIAECAPPARGLGLIRSARRCARLLRGRRLRWPTVRQFPAAALD